MPSNYKRLGDYIQEVNIRNTDLKIDKLIGVSIEKKFISSVANIVGTDMSVYKVIKKNQLACKLMSVGRDEKLPVDLYLSDEPAIISSAYYVFESKNNKVLLPEYLKMWLFRKENDRYVGYISGGDVRGGISWDTFCDMPINIPSVEKQQEIVREYNTIQNRIALNNQFISKLQETAQAIYKQWFVDEIDLENLPNEWCKGYLNDICEFSNKRIAINDLTLENYISTENMLPDRIGIIFANNLPTTGNVINYEMGNILISNIRPYLKKIWLANFDGGCSNDVLCFVPKSNIPSLYLYQILEKDIFFEYVMAGSKGTKMPRGDKKWIMNYEIVIPNRELLDKFDKVSQIFQKDIQLKKKQNQKLEKLKELLLAKMTRVERETKE
jgi:type I restriction enzyme S subunit